MHKSPGILSVFSILFFCTSLEATASPQNLAALFQVPKQTKTKQKGSKKIPNLPIPPEYEVYFKAKSVLNRKADLPAIELVEKEILQQRMSVVSKALDRDLDEIFYALEIKRGVKFAQKKSWDASFRSFTRALNELSPYKWIFYWTEESSKYLASVCTRNKKKTDEACLTLAKKVSDAFPKNALETKMLRDLPVFESSSTNEVTGDRLSQTYTEKTEKDEEAFKDVLDAFLKGKDSDLTKAAKEFVGDYPKSILRFRATFLMAESLFKAGNKKDAREKYLSLIHDVPLSFYAIVSAERIGVSLRDQVAKTPIQIDLDALNPNLNEQQTLDRAKALFNKKHEEEVGIELDTLLRYRSYTTDFILYLMKFATEANQNLTSFRLANELIQRKYDGFLNQEFLALIFPDRYLNEIEAESTLDHLDPLLVMSLIKQESGFKAQILSSSGALGLMQLMSFTAIDTKKDVVLSHLKDPVENIAVGEKYLSNLLIQYEGNIPYALAAYNAGPHRVAKWRKEAPLDAGMIEWIEAIPFKETREYVMAILRNRYWYQYRHDTEIESIFKNWKTTLTK